MSRRSDPTPSISSISIMAGTSRLGLDEVGNSFMNDRDNEDDEFDMDHCLGVRGIKILNVPKNMQKIKQKSSK